MQIILYKEGNNFLYFLIKFVVYARFSFWSPPVLIIEEKTIKIKGKEKENTNNKAINCFI